MKNVMNQFALLLGCALLFNFMGVSNSVAAEEVNCPAEIKSGTDFPMADANNKKWHDSNSLNLKVDYKVVCTWKDAVASKRKEGNVCTYSTFSECSVEGTPAGTKFYVTDYKPKIKAVKAK